MSEQRTDLREYLNFLKEKDRTHIDRLRDLQSGQMIAFWSISPEMGLQIAISSDYWNSITRNKFEGWLNDGLMPGAPEQYLFKEHLADLDQLRRLKSAIRGNHIPIVNEAFLTKLEKARQTFLIPKYPKSKAVAKQILVRGSLRSLLHHASGQDEETILSYWKAVKKFDGSIAKPTHAKAKGRETKEPAKYTRAAFYKILEALESELLRALKKQAQHSEPYLLNEDALRVRGSITAKPGPRSTTAANEQAPRNTDTDEKSAQGAQTHKKRYFTETTAGEFIKAIIAEKAKDGRFPNLDEVRTAAIKAGYVGARPMLTSALRNLKLEHGLRLGPGAPSGSRPPKFPK